MTQTRMTMGKKTNRKTTMESLSLEELLELKSIVQEARLNNAIREINKLLTQF